MTKHQNPYQVLREVKNSNDEPYGVDHVNEIQLRKSKEKGDGEREDAGWRDRIKGQVSVASSFDQLRRRAGQLVEGRAEFAREKT